MAKCNRPKPTSTGEIMIAIAVFAALRAGARKAGARRIMQRRGLLLSALSALSLAACGLRSATHALADVTRTQTVQLEAVINTANIIAIEIELTGRIEGRAEMVLILNGKPYKTAALAGPVSVRWRGDWYAPTTELQYRADAVKSGALTIRYRFVDL